MRIAVSVGTLAILLLLLPACGGSSSQMEYFQFDHEGWSANDTLSVRIDSVEEERRYQLQIALRTSSARSYPYRQLVMEVEQEWSQRDSATLDTITFLISEWDGEVNGRGVAVFSYEYLLDTIDLHKGDSGIIRMRHLMRRSPLPGIYNVGVLLK